jgi:hypothetical protein
VTVTLQSPSGGVTAVALRADAAGRLSGVVRWGAPGAYVLRALVGQHAVANSAMQVSE